VKLTENKHTEINIRFT